MRRALTVLVLMIAATTIGCAASTQTKKASEGDPAITALEQSARHIEADLRQLVLLQTDQKQGGLRAVLPKNGPLGKKIVMKWHGPIEPAIKRIARSIKRALGRGELGGTADLARVVAAALPGSRKRQRIHPATRTFQALRMAVNDEMASLERFLQTFHQVLRPGGRVAVIAFHSLEDRAVKQRFARLADPCTCPPDLPLCACGRQPVVSVLTWTFSSSL